jgi:hypothetical protein
MKTAILLIFAWATGLPTLQAQHSCVVSHKISDPPPRSKSLPHTFIFIRTDTLSLFRALDSVKSFTLFIKHRDDPSGASDRQFGYDPKLITTKHIGQGLLQLSIYGKVVDIDSPSGDRLGIQRMQLVLSIGKLSETAELCPPSK